MIPPKPLKASDLKHPKDPGKRLYGAPRTKPRKKGVSVTHGTNPPAGVRQIPPRTYDHYSTGGVNPVALRNDPNAPKVAPLDYKKIPSIGDINAEDSRRRGF